MFSQIDTQIVRTWRQYSIEPKLAKLTGRVPRTTGPRIAVAGNCQAFGVAYAMKLLDISATVDHFPLVARSRAGFDLFVKTLDTYDYVFAHPFLDHFVPGGDSEELAKRLGAKVIPFPAITFAAFHPDFVFLLQDAKGHAALFGPVGPYHSALGLFAYRKGLTIEEANALFHGDVFEALGYYRLWNDALRELLAYTANFDLDISQNVLNWSRRGIFMYSNVHPRPFVLGDLARILFKRAGLEAAQVNMDDFFIHDLARGEIMPVYPEIARKYGAVGGYTFKLVHHRLSKGVGDFLNLPQYLASCYKIYSGSRTDQLLNPRVEGWLADTATSEMLVEMARENRKKGLMPVQ